MDWDRFAYARYNPLIYTDPTGHDPVLGFIQGFLSELNRTNAWFAPGYQEKFAIRDNETNAELTGRLSADVVSLGIGLAEAGGGTFIAGSGVAACGTGVLCVAGAPAIVGGGALISQGTGTVSRAGEGAGSILSMWSHRNNDQGGGESENAFSNLKLSSEFEKRVKDWNISEDEVMNVLNNGKKFTDEQGRSLLWDPKSKLLISVDKIDGELVTIYEQEKPSRTWKNGWFEDIGD